MFRVCVVEDEGIIREGLRVILEQAYGQKVEICSVENGERCMDLLMEFPLHVLVTDIRMPEMDGLRLMGLVGERYPEIQFVVLSGYDDFTYCKRALQYGAVDYLLKPVDETELLIAVDRAMTRIADCCVTGADIQYSRTMQRILEYIKRHYADSVSLETLAEKFYYNPRYLSQLFKKETGINFVDYINQVRVQRAKQFLRQEELRVEEVALRVGFHDPKYFARIFKNSEDMTPTEYRRR